MATAPDPRLQRLLGGPALAALRQRLRRHYERGGTDGGRLLLDRLQAHEQEALALLSGRPARPARSLRLDLADLQARLQAAGLADSLRAALERLDGPIADATAERAAAQAAWAAVQTRPGRDPRLGAWLQAATGLGLLKRLARQDPVAAEDLLTQAGAVLARLPAAGLPRSQLAALALGDAHALDAGRPTATLVLAAWRHGEASADALAAEPDTPPQEERIRDVWARAGVLVNELARPVLVLNLPVPRHLDAAPWLCGEPAYLSLRWLLRQRPDWPVAGRPVFVCENPNLLAIAAERLGTHGAPLVCTDGMPAAAQRSLLEQLGRAGAHLRCHADFDWAGVRIVNHLLTYAGATPWRMDSARYEAAAHQATASGLALAGPDAEARWDAALAPAMRRHGRAIAEEALADTLLEDLTTGP
ncbi:TIGR02679 family protein [Pseudorhodoferax sp.]|uniref:TIGR02679 family protein n=1 Tax=Pseudorhodoferax sp. TaxID=1993553 RepID=UPI0039E4B587